MGMSRTCLSFAWALCTGICSYFLLVQEFVFHLVEFPKRSTSEDLRKKHSVLDFSSIYKKPS